MTPASFLLALLGDTFQLAGRGADNRLAVEGLAFGPQEGEAGVIGVTARTLEAAALQLAAGPLTLEIGRVTLRDLAARVSLTGPRPRLLALDAATVELAGVKVHGPLSLPPQWLEAWRADGAAPASTPEVPPAERRLDPLATLDGKIRSEIVDAALIFDAIVTVPIRQGRIDFNQATVEHVGPDSRMGISPQGLYVDAPNGRSYVYRFAQAPTTGVTYERRGALLGLRVADRGQLRLQELAEAQLPQLRQGRRMGSATGQARQLFDRTAVSGEVQPGDGIVALTGLRAELTGRAQGRNAIHIRSEAVGRGLSVGMTSLLLRHLVLGACTCEDISAALTFQLTVDNGQLRFAFHIADAKLSGVKFQPVPA